MASIRSIESIDWLSAGSDLLRHRGPDHAAMWWSQDQRVGLAHRRLAIIDLSEAGHQPMRQDRDGSVIVFNGEIYNFLDIRKELGSKGHTFQSRSDTEVILAAYREWGTDCLDRLNGMFAFAIYDPGHSRMFLARDRAGEKPLFYRHDSGTLRFASELKAMLADRTIGRRIDPKALDCYLAMGYVPGERCLIEGFSKLPPAHAMVFDTETDELKTWCYWRPPEASVSAVSNDVDEPTLLDRLEQLLEKAVRRQLVADVPVGVLLSGGVDSSLVASMAARAGGRVRTYTVTFNGHGQHDESLHARLVANHFSTDHLELDGSEVNPDIMFDLARHFDEPIADSSMIPTSLICSLAQTHCRVALGGDGGDELFGGYSHYTRLLDFAAIARWIPKPLRTAAARIAQHGLPLDYPRRHWLHAFSQDCNSEVPLTAMLFDDTARSSYFTRGRVAHAEAEWKVRSRKTGHLLDRAMRTDFDTYLPEDILVKVDRASMMHSLEVRAPFLDRDLTEFAFREVPTQLKATRHDRKILLKRLVSRLLPPEFDLQRKQGFGVPLDTWLRNEPWQSFFEEILMSRPNNHLNQSAVGAMLKNQRAGQHNGEKLFALALLELWINEYKIQVS